jgi:dTMP kinase
MTDFRPPRAGVLIVLEGIDGAGTTTQAELLVEHLRRAQIPAHLTREPSDGPIGQLLRAALRGDPELDVTTMSLLFAADRADHMSREVLPHLRQGTVVVSDRWYHSSLAYQGTEEDRQWILDLNARIPAPDLTILLDVAPAVAARRRAARGGPTERYDQLDVQERVARGYQEAVALLGQRERIEVIDGNLPPPAVAESVSALAREVLEATLH